MPVWLDCDDRDFDLLEDITGRDWSKLREKSKERQLGAVRFSTMEMLCIIKGCQPGDILKYESDGTTLSDLRKSFAGVVEQKQPSGKPYAIAAAIILIVIAAVLIAASRLA